MHVQWLHSVHANEPQGHSPMGGLFRLRLHKHLGSSNPLGEDLIDAELPLHWRIVFIRESFTEKGILYANVNVHVDQFNQDDLQEGLE